MFIGALWTLCGHKATSRHRARQECQKLDKVIEPSASHSGGGGSFLGGPRNCVLFTCGFLEATLGIPKPMHKTWSEADPGAGRVQLEFPKPRRRVPHREARGRRQRFPEGL